jgi:hypothetical protein
MLFQLPVLVFRASETPCSDPRRDRRERTLRQFKDISFLNPLPGATPEYLYEAVTTCTVAGTNDWHWEATMFTDTYYDGEDTIRETIWEYHQNKVDAQFNADPLTRGIVDADLPEWNPRKYFILALHHRLKHTYREWLRTVEHIEKRFEQLQKVLSSANNYDGHGC